MDKDSQDHGDFCPHCVNDNDNEAVSSTTQGEDDCCSCCCSLCNSYGSDAEEANLNPITPGDIPTSERALAHKKAFLASMSLVRTKRERASLENILQFVEGLTYSNNFLRHYNNQSQFCFRCFQEPVCSCCIEGLSNLNIGGGSCSCSACDTSCTSGRSEEVESLPCSCPECLHPNKETIPASRVRSRRNRRRRRRQGTYYPISAERRFQLEQRSANNEQNQLGGCDSDCTQCRQEPNSSTFNYEQCNCDECSQQLTHKEICSEPQQSRTSSSLRSGSGRCTDCSQDSLNEVSLQPCLIPDCKDCYRRNKAVPPRNQEGNVASNSRYNIPEMEALELLENSLRREDELRRLRRAEISVPPNRGYTCENHSTLRVNDSCSCDCEECQNPTDCSDESCYECNIHAFRRKNNPPN